MDPTLEFISSLGSNISADSKELEEDATVVNQTVDDLIDIASEQPLSKVGFSIKAMLC